MRHLTGIRLENFKCFPYVDLHLEPTVYAITACRVTDGESSNWSGKSALVGAIQFALTGRHDAEVDDAWITTGAKEGSVHLFFEDGSVIRRSRKRGRSTQLEYGASTGTEIIAKQDEAQILITRAMGIAETDFLATCFFEQGQMARFITAAPADRLHDVRSWFRLEKLERCEMIAADAARTVAAHLAGVEQAIASMRALEAREIAEGETLEDLEEQAREISTSIAVGTSTRDRIQAKILEGSRQNYEAMRLEEAKTLTAEGKRLVKTMPDLEVIQRSVSAARDQESEARANVSEARRELQGKKQIARGDFDGRCPVANIECPARAQINADRHNSAKLEAVAEKNLQPRLEALRVAEALVATLTLEQREAINQQERIRALRERLAAIKVGLDPNAQPAANLDELRADLARLQESIGTSISQLASVQRSIAIVTDARKEIASLETKREGLHAKLKTHQEAAIVFGKQGAQRRVAEVALGRIEAGANEMLAASGIALTVELRWSREGSGLARTCGACGHPYPESRKVKECERCHVARGPNLVNKLEVVLSNTSGAAKDLAGAAIQLTASAWLRTARDAAWSVAVLDEPFGALDASNRRAFSQHLTTMLRSRQGFEQAFVISHTLDTANALPGRIEIVSSGEGPDARSTARVVS